ncbi:VanZ family protein [Halobacteriovorax sp. HLS]|uniref:VanZ family protein n=1 Tax=Halobacteriovorax sp. HLS TaxID=2234000 RepID=UPI001F4EACD9|nr:VanZ family protein [Halobacteriovorax sp. HLS]
MKKLNLKILWLGLGITYIIAMFYFSLRYEKPGKPPFEHFDKILHFNAYLLLMGYFSLTHEKKNHFKLLITFVLMGISIEFLQLASGYRSFELLDVVANTAGLICGGIISRTYFPNLITKLDSLLYVDNT